jgi:hypothetical protein
MGGFMKKLAIVLSTAALAVLTLGVYSCTFTLPQAVELRAEPSLSLPVNSDAFNLSKMLSDVIKDPFEGIDGLKLYDWTTRTDAQTYLVHYPLISENLDLGEYFDEIKNSEDLFEDLQINQSIDIPDLGVDIEPQEIQIPVQDIFGDFEDQIANNLKTYTGSINAVSDGGIAFKDYAVEDPIEFDEFDSATFSSGKLVVDFTVTNTVTNADITIQLLKIIGSDSNEIELKGAAPVQLGVGHPTGSFEVDLAGVTLPGSFTLVVNYEDNTTGLGPGGKETINLKMEPSIIDLAISRIEGLNFNFEYAFDPMNFPLDLPSYIKYAEIGAGNLTLTALLPNGEGSNEINTDLSEVTVIPNIAIYQGGTGGIHLSSPDDSTPGVFVYSLDGQTINHEDLYIENEANKKVVLEGNKISLTINPAEEEITVLLQTAFTIDSLAEVQVDISELPGATGLSQEINVPLTTLTDFVKSISIHEIGARLTLTEVGIAGLAVQVSSSAFVMTPNTPQNIPLVPLTDPLTEEIVTFTNSVDPLTLVLNPDGGDPLESITFTVSIQPKNDPDILTLEDITPGKTLAITGTAEILFDWIAATIDISSLGGQSSFEGTFPGEGGDPLDLSAMNDYLDGFNFEGIEAYIYMSAPEEFADLAVFSMELTALYGDTTEIDLISGNGEIVFGSLPVLPGPASEEKYIYSAATAPAGYTFDISEGLTTILNNRDPFRMKYKIDAGSGITITKAMIEDEDIDTTFAVEMIIVLPLSLTAGTASDGGKAKIVIPDLFEDKAGQDLLGRDDDAYGEGSFFGMITSLEFEIGLTDAVFNGGRIHISDSPKLEFPLSGTSLGFNLTEAQMKQVNAGPLIPNIYIEFDKDGELKIPRNLGATRISFSADINYHIDL